MPLPSWLKKRAVFDDKTHKLKTSLRNLKLHTVCEEARCPNLGECFSRGTATIMILGDICTRHCGFCAVKSGNPLPIDPDEPARVASQIREMGLEHAVVTSVTRDDLADGGAGHFAKTIREIKKVSPTTTVEVLVPDFEGNLDSIKKVCDVSPGIFNHNIETVESLTPKIRSKASYVCSLKVLKAARGLLSNGLTKSGLMVGLGETFEEIKETMKDLRSVDVDVLTIGQYLQPTKDSLPVVNYLEPEKFDRLKEEGEKIGFKYVFSGPFVRSSYLADRVVCDSSQ